MPWIPELRKEEEDKVKEMIKLGLLEPAALKKFKSSKGDVARKFLQPKLFEKTSLKDDGSGKSGNGGDKKKMEEQQLVDDEVFSRTIKVNKV